jgi:hypothetical protein
VIPRKWYIRAILERATGATASSCEEPRRWPGNPGSAQARRADHPGVHARGNQPGLRGHAERGEPARPDPLLTRRLSRFGVRPTEQPSAKCQSKQLKPSRPRLVRCASFGPCGRRSVLRCELPSPTTYFVANRCGTARGGGFAGGARYSSAVKLRRSVSPFGFPPNAAECRSGLGFPTALARETRGGNGAPDRQISSKPSRRGETGRKLRLNN